MDIQEHETMWYPGIYGGRQEALYQQKVADVSLQDLVNIVAKRADEDGNWAIDNGFVGDNADKMRRMIKWVSDPINIEQCVGHIRKEGREYEVTVDYVCRDLANASKWSVRS